MSLVCRCFDVEKDAIVTAIENGCSTLEAIRNQLGVSSHCAACLPDIEDLLDFYGTKEERGSMEP